MSKRFDGHYLGIVVQNNDPDKRGRLKIFVPHVSPTVYNKWNEVQIDKQFNFIGQNLTSSINDILDDLKKILPWADCAMPLFGGGGGRYNATELTGSISDSSLLDTTKPDSEFKTTGFSQNTDGIGEKPANLVEKGGVKISDAFYSSPKNNTNRVNPNAYAYTPSSYSNRAKGIFSIPNVGAHVWVFFLDGNPLRPVYWALSYGQSDWQGIYDDDYGVAEDYPGTYENMNEKNKALKAQRSDVETYRNKLVMSQKGGVIEIVNTDMKEVIKLTHYSGSFLEFNNDTTTKLSTKNDQTLVMNDQFLTVKGYKNLYVARDLDNVILGDVYWKIGNVNTNAHQQWKSQVDPIADLKQLFEIDRTKKKDGDPNRTSSLNQKQKGSPGKCPVCSKGRTYYAVNNNFNSVNIPVVTIRSDGVDKYDTVRPQGKQANAQNISFPPTNRCPVCGKSGKSPSSMDGKWGENPEKKKLEQLYQNKIVDLSKIEEDIGLGGCLITEIAKHKIETVGLVMNDFGSIRIDPEGKIYNFKVQIDEQGVYESQKSSPLIEPVHVDDLPGGNYTINACNRYTLQVGAGGVSIKTLGPIEMSGTITSIAGQQVNIGAQYELNIDGGQRTVITSDILVLRQRNYDQVLVDSSLGVSRNLVVGGGAHIEGELTVHHITAPVEIQQTEKTFVYGETVNEKRIGSCVVSGGSSSGTWPVYGFGHEPDCLFTYSHSHLFKNLPLNLVPDNKSVRKVGAKSNMVERSYADPQNNNYNMHGVGQIGLRQQKTPQRPIVR
jgi:hypothetical protein